MHDQEGKIAQPPTFAPVRDDRWQQFAVRDRKIAIAFALAPEHALDPIADHWLDQRFKMHARRLIIHLVLLDQLRKFGVLLEEPGIGERLRNRTVDRVLDDADRMLNFFNQVRREIESNSRKSATVSSQLANDWFVPKISNEM